MIKVYSPDGKKLCLNIGCGENIKKDINVKWINVDSRQLRGVDFVVNATKLGFDNNVFSVVYASHILEHFSHLETVDILKEWTRVLKKEGKLFIAVPDILKIAKGFVEAKVGVDMVVKYLYGGQGYGNNFHKAGFCYSLLSKKMEEIGLKEISVFEGNKKDASGSFYSLNIKGVKK